MQTHDGYKFMYYLLILLIAICQDSIGAIYRAERVERNTEPVVVIGNPRAKNEITIYFSPSCAHCAQWEKEELPIIRKTLKKKNAKVIVKVLLANALDLFAARLAWCRGSHKVFNIYKMLLENQDDWFEHSLEKQIPPDLSSAEKEKRIDKRKKDIQKFLETSSEDKNELKDFISPEDPMLYVKLFFLNNGFSVEELNQALSDHTLNKALFDQSRQAVKEDGKYLDYVPAFYINGKLLDYVLTAEKFDKILPDILKNKNDDQ